jgi:hypothetical protein
VTSFLIVCLFFSCTAKYLRCRIFYFVPFSNSFTPFSKKLPPNTKKALPIGKASIIFVSSFLIVCLPSLPAPQPPLVQDFFLEQGACHKIRYHLISYSNLMTLIVNLSNRLLTPFNHSLNFCFHFLITPLQVQKKPFTL